MHLDLILFDDLFLDQKIRNTLTLVALQLNDNPDRFVLYSRPIAVELFPKGRDEAGVVKVLGKSTDCSHALAATTLLNADVCGKTGRYGAPRTHNGGAAMQTDCVCDFSVGNGIKGICKNVFGKTGRRGQTERSTHTLAAVKTRFTLFAQRIKRLGRENDEKQEKERGQTVSHSERERTMGKKCRKWKHEKMAFIVPSFVRLSPSVFPKGKGAFWRK